MRLAIVSAANSDYFELLSNLISNLQAGSGKLPEHDMIVLNSGLLEHQVEKLESNLVKVINPPAVPNLSGHIPTYYTAFTTRPRLPKLLPEYECILWVDADVWFQEPDAVADYAEAARNYDVACCAENDRSYSSFFMQPHNAPDYHRSRTLTPYYERYQQFFARHFSSDDARVLGSFPLLNSGIFCASSKSRLWSDWEHVLTETMLRHGEHFMADPTTSFFDLLAEQTTFNAVVRMNNLKLNVMPSSYNWLCHRSTPVFDEERQLLCERSWPHAPIKAIHLTLPASKKGAIEVPKLSSISNGGYETIQKDLTKHNLSALHPCLPR